MHSLRNLNVERETWDGVFSLVVHCAGMERNVIRSVPTSNPRPLTSSKLCAPTVGRLDKAFQRLERSDVAMRLAFGEVDLNSESRPAVRAKIGFAASLCP